MILKLTTEEIETVLLDCFCNGGLGELLASDIDYVYNKAKYQQFRVEGTCFEDNLMNLLRGGGRIKFIDLGDEDNTKFLTLQSAIESLSEISDANIIEKVKDILVENGNADAWHGYEILQFVLYGEIIYG